MQPGRGEKEGSSTVLLPRYNRSGGEEELECHFLGFSYKYFHQPCDGPAGADVAGGVGEVGGGGGVWSKI